MASKISQLPAATTVARTDQLEINQGGASLSATASQVASAIVLAASGAAVTAPADTNENTLVTITVPANAMGANGILRITTLWTYTNSANSKTLRVKFGGTTFMGVSQTTSNTYSDQRNIANRNATNSQVAWPQGSGSGGFNVSGSAVTTGTIDTTSSQDILITAQKASGAETLILERYLVELLRAV